MLCEKCSSIHFKRVHELPLSQRAFIQDQNEELIFYFHHESLSALEQSKANCGFCRKLWNGFEYNIAQNQADDEIDPGSPVYLSIWVPDVDFQENGDSLEGAFRFQMVNASCSTLRLWAFFTRYVSDTMRLYLESLNFGIDDDITTISSRNIELARMWLQHCQDHHQPCQQLATPGPAPLRIIDISDPKKPFLVMGEGRLVPYATLSYKWGDSVKHLTTSENISQHQERIPLARLPKTFKEAFEVAQALGFRYFWIDALCIQHNVSDELNEQIERMGEIYTFSTLTIFAAAGDNSDHGLQAARDGALCKPSAVRIRVTLSDRELEAPFYLDTFKPHPPQQDQGPPLTKRGWVLQEEGLSARGLWFGRNEMRWVCLCQSATESSPGVFAVERIDKAALKYYLAGIDSLMMSMRYQLREGRQQQDIQEITAWGRGIVQDEWYKLVENFTTRELTYPSDVLPALSGMASRVSEIHGLHYVAGLWEEDLQLGLLWESETANTHLDPIRWDSTPTTGELQGNGNSSDHRLVTSNTNLRVARELVRDQNTERVAASDLHRDLENITSTGKATFSWISHYLSGKGVKYNLTGKYDLEPQLGLQVLQATVRQSPILKNPFGEILSASLKVRARVRKARLVDEDVIYSKNGPFRLTDADESPTSKHFVADFYPDSLDMVERFKVIHCVLCAVGKMENLYQQFKGKVLGCIGVVPSPTLGKTNRFVRVGLVKVLDEKWFMGDYTDVRDLVLI